MPELRHFVSVLLVLIITLASTTTVLSEKVHRNQSPNGIDRRKAAIDAAISSSSTARAVPPPPTTTITTIQQQCGSCKTHEELKQRNIDAIKSEVLRRLGFDSAPNITGRPLPRVTSDQLARMDMGGYFGMDGMQSDQPYETGPKVFEEEDEYHIKTEMVVAYARQSSHKHRHNHSNQLHFVFSENTLKYHVKNATLFVYVRGTGSKSGTTPHTFHLDVIQTNPNKSGKGGEVVMASKKVTQARGEGEWVTMDVTNMVGGWFKAAAIWGGIGNRGSREDKWGFAIRPQSILGKQVVAINAEGDDAKVPFVEIQTEETKSRKRRNVGLNCNETSTEPLCCRYPLTVDFEAFGWDFIIAPKQYEANYCAGDCPLFTLQKYAHTHLLKMAAPTSAAPCCAPRQMSSITMLYFDPNLNVVFGKLPGMVVDRCGCS